MKKPIGGAVYILPNLITTGNLFFGFFSIVKSLQAQYTWAGSAILLAAIFDVFDGRVARLTKGTSEFGVQYDSLCDLVSFGLAPAFLMYQYGLSGLGRIGWIVCFIFLACGALRLARFNVQSSIGSASGDFTGLPIPMAAIVIACFVIWVEELVSSGGEGVWLTRNLYDLLLSSKMNQAFLLLSSPLIAIAMVSNLSYRSHKSLRLSGIKPFRLLVIFILVLAFVAYEPAFCGFVLSLGYALSGPFEWAAGWKVPTSDDEIFAQVDEDEDRSSERPLDSKEKADRVNPMKSGGDEA